MSRLQRWLVGLVTLAILLVAALAVVPPLLNWNAYKDKVEATVTEAIARETRISGDLKLNLLPRPSFSATGISVANREGGESPHLAAVDRLDVELRLAPLLRGAIEVERLVLERPAIALEKSADGQVNWDLGPAEAPDGGGTVGASSAPSEESDLPELKLERFRLIDGIVTYRDLGSTAPVRTLRIADAELTAQSLSGPFSLDGKLSFDDAPLALEAEVGQLNGASTPFSLVFDLGGGSAKGDLRGRFAHDAGAVKANARLRVEAPELARALALFEVPSHPLYAAPFSASAEIEGTTLGAKIESLRVTLGDNAAEGRSELTFGPPQAVKATLTTTHLDLDKLLSSAATPPSEAAQGGGGQGAPTQSASGATAFALPKDLLGELALSVDALVYRGQVVRQARLDARLADGEVEIERALALLPGGGDLGLSGRVSTEAAGPRFRGHLEAAADNLRATLTWLGADLSFVPADRLRKATVSTAIDATARNLTLNNVDLRFDTTRATGGLALALRDRPAFGLGLTLDKLNLDAYLPGANGAAGVVAPPGASGTTAPSAPATTTPAAHWANAFDANLDVKLNQLTYGGENANELALEATLDRGRMTVRRAAIGDFAGTQALFSGVLDGLATTPTVDGRVTLKVGAPQRLARLAALDPKPFERLGALDLDGTVKGSLAGAEVDLQALALGGDMKAVGRVTPLAAPPGFDLTLETSHPDLAKLAARFSEQARLDPKAGPLTLKARLVGNGRDFALENLSGKVGPTDVSGRVKVALGGVRPAVAAELKTGELPLAVFAAPAAAGTPSSGSGGATTRNAGRQERWSREPLDLSALRAFDLALTLEAAAVTHKETRIEPLRATADLADGVLTVSQFTGGLHGGELSGTGSLDARQQPALALDLKAKRLQLARLVPRLPAVGKLEGPLDVDARLSGSGGSEAELVSSLAGDGRIGGAIEIPRAGGAAPVIGALSALLQDKVKETRALAQLTDAPLTLLGSGADISGTFVVENGVARTRDTRLDGKSGAEALLTGDADLPKWLLDAELKIAKAKGAEPDLIVAARGPLDEPDVKLSGPAVKQPDASSPQPSAAPPATEQPSAPQPSAAPQPFAAPQPSGQQAPQPSGGQASNGEQPRRQLTPQEIIEQGLKGLLPGLGN